MSTSACTYCEVKATKLTTTSNVISPTAARTAAGSRTSAWITSAPSGAGRQLVEPRLRMVRSIPAATARREQAELMTPVPPMNKTFSAVMTSPTSMREFGRPRLTYHGDADLPGVGELFFDLLGDVARDDLGLNVVDLVRQHHHPHLAASLHSKDFLDSLVRGGDLLKPLKPLHV